MRYLLLSLLLFASLKVWTQNAKEPDTTTSYPYGVSSESNWDKLNLRWSRVSNNLTIELTNDSAQQGQLLSRDDNGIYLYPETDVIVHPDSISTKTIYIPRDSIAKVRLKRNNHIPSIYWLGRKKRIIAADALCYTNPLIHSAISATILTGFASGYVPFLVFMVPFTLVACTPVAINAGLNLSQKEGRVIYSKSRSIFNLDRRKYFKKPPSYIQFKDGKVEEVQSEQTKPKQLGSESRLMRKTVIRPRLSIQLGANYFFSKYSEHAKLLLGRSQHEFAYFNLRYFNPEFRISYLAHRMLSFQFEANSVGKRTIGPVSRYPVSQFASAQDWVTYRSQQLSVNFHPFSKSKYRLKDWDVSMGLGFSRIEAKFNNIQHGVNNSDLKSISTGYAINPKLNFECFPNQSFSYYFGISGQLMQSMTLPSHINYDPITKAAFGPSVRDVNLSAFFIHAGFGIHAIRY